MSSESYGIDCVILHTFPIKWVISLHIVPRMRT